MERDWLQVVTGETCDECGLAAAAVPADALPDRHRDVGARWARHLEETPVEALRRHPAPGVWSPLEYGCHVRDVLAVFADRADQAVAEEHPRWGWWDQDAAVTEERYNAQDPRTVATALSANADRLAALLAGLDDAQRARTGERRDGEVFTVEGLGRFALHEAEHHLHDVQ
jgi:hypothetical protein